MFYGSTVFSDQFKSASLRGNTVTIKIMREAADKLKIAFALFACALLFPHLTHAEEIKAPNMTVELVSELRGIKPGGKQYLALRMKPAPDWHVYWKYHGDSGTPPKVKWQQSNSLKIGEIEWPAPRRIKIGHLANYGYEREVFLLMPMTASTDLKPGEKIEVRGKADWLVCQEECVPGSAPLAIDFIVSESEIRTEFYDKIQSEKDNLPLKIHEVKAAATAQGDKISLEVTAPGFELKPEEIVFIPDSAKQIENGVDQEVVISESGVKINLTKSRSDSIPEVLSGLVLFPKPVEMTAEVQMMGGESGGGADITRLSFLSAAAFAFIGGLILNLMPCVFPILSIKILGFVKKGGENRAKVMRHGAFFALGVLLSFWALLSLLFFLQGVGAKLGWGFQLQSTEFLSFMIVILFLIGLNLCGVFEFGGKLQNIAGRVSARGYLDSFLNGVLATLLATPCTAPFMGSAVAYALASSKPAAFLVFTFLALGMALPYVVFSSSPALLNRLPKPGAWMEKFKQFLAFPIFATVIWLIGVLLNQAGSEYTYRLLFSLLFTALAVWFYSNFKGLFKLASALPLFAATLLVMPRPDGSPKWQEFSNKALEESVNTGRPVFVDYTADWCLTCKLNKFVALERAEVIAAFEKKKVVLLRADWTSMNDEITAAIESHGRNGVPLNVLYYGGGNKSPYLFPAILTPGMVVKELEKINIKDG